MVALDAIAHQAFGPELSQGCADHDAAGDLGQRHAGGFGDERYRAAGPRVGLDHEDLVALHGVLHIDQALDVERLGDPQRVVLDDRDGLRRKAGRRDRAGGVAGVHARLLHMLHDRTDDRITGVIPQRVDIDLGGVLQETIDEYGALGRQAALLAETAEAGEFGHGPTQVIVVVHDLHRSAAEHITGTNEGGVADLGGDLECLIDVDGGAAGRLRDLEASAHGVPLLTVLGEIDRRRRGAEHERLG